MADFLTSTHRAKWIFTPHELKEKYKAANHRAKQMLEKEFRTMRPTWRARFKGGFKELDSYRWFGRDKYGATRVDVDLDGTLSYPEVQSDVKENGEKHSRTKPLKIEEEQHLRAFYEFKIQDVCDAFKFPRKIQATALIYFKRFYLQWSVMEHHPKDIMLTCIYTACKAEENHVSAEELGKGIDQDHQVILNNEMIVLQSLGFDLIVYSPYRPIDGFINDMEDFIYSSNGQLQHLKDLHETAKMVADKTMRTEASLLFSPGQLALAALRRANEEYPVVNFERYLNSILSRQHPARPVPELTKYLDAIDQMVNNLVTPTASDMKHIDRKLKYCRDPGSHDKSKKRKHRSRD